MSPADAVDAAELSQRVEIQSQSTATDGFGQPLNSWTTFYRCWAKIAVKDSALVYARASFIAKATHFITIRWTSSQVIQPNMQVLYTEPTTKVVHTYQIDALLNPDQENRRIVMLVHELDGAE